MASLVTSHCPQNMSSDEKEGNHAWKNLTSEYTQMYEQWPRQEKVTICPPSNGEFISDATAQHNMKTMYGDNFVQHETTKRTRCFPPKPSHQFASEPMDCKSTYDTCFEFKKGRRPPAFKPNPSDHQTIHKGNDVKKISVNQQTYRTYTRPEVLEAKRCPIIIESENAVIQQNKSYPFTITTVQEDFRKPDSSIPRRQPAVQGGTGSPFATGTEITISTTNQADFTVKQLPTKPMTPSRVMVREKEGKLSISPNKHFYFRSTVQNDYIQHPTVRRPKSFKPPYQYNPSETPFQHQTLYANDFKKINQKNIRIAFQIPEGNLKIDKGPFQDTTQYREIHCQSHPPIERRTLAKPKSKHEIAQKFFGDTSYSTSYRNFDGGQHIKRNNYKPARNYLPPNIKFTAESTAHAHYKGVPAPRSKICKPVTNKRIDVACLNDSC